MKNRLIAFIITGSLALLAGPSCAQPAGPIPPELEGVGITEKLESQIPLDAEFLDETGKAVKLRDYFDGKRPVLLTLNYYGCPMLCGLMLNGMLEALKEMSWVPGKEFELVTVSFDPGETPILAKNKKQNYLRELGRPEAAKGWHFLTGRENHIKALTESVGFGYKYNDERQEYMHVAALILLTPEGKVSRYLYGIVFEPETIRLSLVEAAEGKSASAIDKVLLFCFHYDSVEGKYTLAAVTIVRILGVFTLLALVGFIYYYWRSDSGRLTSSPIEGHKT